MNTIELIHDIEERRAAHYLRERQQYPRRQPILSDLNDCVRRDVLAILHWEDTPLPGVDLLYRFEAGNVWQRQIVRELLEIGFDVSHEPRTFELHGRANHVIARGRIDGCFHRGKSTIPYEIKTAAPGLFMKAHELNGSPASPWLKKWTRQMQAYLWASDHEEGVFIVTNGLGAWRLVPVAIDATIGEWVLSHCEEVVEHVEVGLLPDFHPDRSVCPHCPFFRGLCQPPDLLREGAILWTDPETLALVEQYRENETSGELFQQAERRLKERAKADANGKDALILAGNAVIKVEIGRTIQHQVPPDVKAQYKMEGQRVCVSVEFP